MSPLLAAALLAAPVGVVTHAGAGPAARPAAPAPAAAAAAAPSSGDDSTVALAGATGARSASASGTGSFAFLHTDASGPVRWNPCAAVPWTFNPKGAPAGGLAALRAAFAELSARTGLTFAYQGTVRDVPSRGYLGQTPGRFRPLLVGWTTAQASDLLAGRDRSTVGMTRVLWSGSLDARGVNHTQIVSAAVALNAASRARTTGSGSWRTYALHELGHAVGLGHVADARQIMSPVISPSVAHDAAGDLGGLRRVGRGSGCLPTLR
jgi:hypothetical protein